MNETLRDGRFVIIGTLGEGSQGRTFDAVDKRVGQPVAVKRFDVRGAASWKDVDLAEREARVLQSLSHPMLPRYVDRFEENGALYLAMEKIEGSSLASLRKRGETLREKDGVRLLHDAADVLAYLHGRAPPVIHRDLKPGNVIRRPDGSFAFVDFGAVRDKLRPEGGSTVVGTFGYMAPEQFQGRALPASDVYAIGATCLAMLTGKQPEDLPHRGLSIDVAAALRGIASERLTRTLAHMLEPDPERRAARSEAPRVSSPSRDRGPHGPESHRQWRQREREARRATKRARRAARRGAPGRGLPFLPVFIVLVALAAARVAVSLALFVAVPAVLTILSLVFGSSLRTAARAVVRGGRRAYGLIEQQARDISDEAEERRAPGDD